MRINISVMKKTVLIIGTLAAVALLGAGCAPRPAIIVPSDVAATNVNLPDVDHGQATIGYGYSEWGFSVQIPAELIVEPLVKSQNATTPPEDVYTLNTRTPSENTAFVLNKQDAFRPSLTVETAANPSQLSVLDWAKAHEADVPAATAAVTVAGSQGISYADPAVGLTVYIFPADPKSPNGKMASIMATKDITADQLNAVVNSVTFGYTEPLLTAPVDLTPAVTYLREGLLRSQDKNILQTRLIAPLTAYYNEKEKNIIAIAITVPQKLGAPYSVLAINKNGGHDEFSFGKFGKDSEEWIPTCMSAADCNFSAAFRAKYPEIVSQFK